MHKPSEKIRVSDGKYEFQMFGDDYRIYVLRYGEPWLIIEQGHKAISSLVLEALSLGNIVSRLEDENAELRAAINKLKENER